MCFSDESRPGRACLPQAGGLHDGLDGLDGLAAPGDLHTCAAGAVQHVAGFVRQPLLLGVVHHLQLLQILGQSVVFGGQPCGGSFADLIRAEAGVHAPVDQLDGGLHRAQR